MGGRARPRLKRSGRPRESSRRFCDVRDIVKAAGHDPREWTSGTLHIYGDKEARQIVLTRPIFDRENRIGYIDGSGRNYHERTRSDRNLTGSTVVRGRAVPIITDEIKRSLAELYSSASRHYHGIGHLKALLSLFNEHRSAFNDPEVVEAAIWFHDAVYETRKNDNEARSADLAAEFLAGRCELSRLRRIVRIIEATADHQVPRFGKEDARNDAALFLDMDLAILGSEPKAFDAYEAAVRKEYSWVDEEAWRSGRTSVLRNFLDRRCIYHTDTFRKRLETKARNNIKRSLARLGGQ